MANQTILDWVNKNKDKKSETGMKDELLKKGWKLEKINDALDVAFGRKTEVQQAQPVQPKKKRVWPWVLLGIVVLIIIIAIASSGGEEKKEAKETAPEVAEEEIAEEKLKLEILQPKRGEKIEASQVELKGKVESPEVEVTVNDEKAGVAPNGNFGIMVDLQEGENTIEIIAKKGEMKTKKTISVTRIPKPPEPKEPEPPKPEGPKEPEPPEPEEPEPEPEPKPEPEPEELDETVGVVSYVVDGDTVNLQTGEKIRLLGINAPEKGQPYYEESKNRLKKLVENKTVTLEKDSNNKDQYGRLLRYLFLNNENINVKLVKEGLATVYIIQPNTKYEAELKKAENEARKKKIGLWTSPKEEEGVCDDRCIGISLFHWNAEGDDCYNLNDEYVIFKNSCSYSCDLTGWTVKDKSSRDPYVFPNFVLGNGGEVTLYTGCGTNMGTKLYWCSSGYSCNAIWNNSGDTLYLRNLNGELILDYSYSGY